MLLPKWTTGGYRYLISLSIELQTTIHDDDHIFDDFFLIGLIVSGEYHELEVESDTLDGRHEHHAT